LTRARERRPYRLPRRDPPAQPHHEQRPLLGAEPVLANEAQPLDRGPLAGLVDGMVSPESDPGQQVVDVDRLPGVGLNEGDDLVRGRRQERSIPNRCSGGTQPGAAPRRSTAPHPYITDRSPRSRVQYREEHEVAHH
jgi:hypothetical protein